MSAGDPTAALVDAWLAPLAAEGAPCGPDLETDNEFLELSKALAGKPETQFSEAVAPDYRAARAIAEALFGRTRDLRIAISWTRAALRLDGVPALLQGLRLMQGLLENFGDRLHPVADPDDGSFYARVNALALLREPSALLGDLRQAVLLTDRVVGKVRVRAVEIALGTLTARADEEALSRDQVLQLFASYADTPVLREQLEHAAQAVRTLSTLLSAQLGPADAPDLAPLTTMLAGVLSLLPQDAAAVEGDAAAAPPTDAAGAPARAGAAMSGGVHSRADAIRAIDMVCEYLERSEPTNPAPLLLRRAKRLINQNFLQLMKDLAPDALAQVAGIMGVDPESVVSPSDGS
jgi:type VI secretion system protein ImpA